MTLVDTIVLVILILIGTAIAPFMIYALGRLISLAVLTSWFELKQKFNKGDDDGKKEL